MLSMYSYTASISILSSTQSSIQFTQLATRCGKVELSAELFDPSCRAYIAQSCQDGATVRVFHG